MLARGAADRTITAYRADLAGAARFAETLGREMPDLGEEELLLFFTEKRLSSLSLSSLKRILASVNMFYRWLSAERSVENPARSITIRAGGSRIPKTLSPEQIDRLMEAADGPFNVHTRDRALLETLYGTGMRASEAAAMDITDINWDELCLRVCGKGGIERGNPAHAPDDRNARRLSDRPS